jgi:hypothetical protein
MGPRKGPAMSVLTTASIWVAGLLLLGAGTLLSMLGTIVVRRRFSFEQLRSNNEVAGFKFATIGVLYAVLLAFAVLVVWEKLNEAEGNVALEAGAAAAIFRLAEGMEPATARDVHAAILAYVDAAIEQDWPAMTRGGEAPAATEALSGVYRALLRDEPAGERGPAVLIEALHQLDLLTQARRARIVVAEGIVPGVIWFTLFVGALVTIGFTFFFGTKHLRAQTLMTGGLATLIFSGLLVIIAIDRPFAGTVRVSPEPLVRVRADFAGAGAAEEAG